MRPVEKLYFGIKVRQFYQKKWRMNIFITIIEPSDETTVSLYSGS